MNDIIKFRSTVEGAFKRGIIVSCVALLAMAVTAVAVCLRSYAFVGEQRSQIYVLDKGQSFLALQSDGRATRDLEVMDHVTRFHELFFNMAPNAATIEQNIDRALNLSDRSAYDYFSDLSEKGFYQRLVQASISQQMVVDSVVVNLSEYPYKAHCYAHQYMIRESNVTAYEFESTCQLIDVARSAVNPHGLMIERFAVIRNESLGTRKRN